jgi:exosortase
LTIFERLKKTGFPNQFLQQSQEGLLLSGLILTAWILALRQLDLEWTINPEYQYGWVVPFLTLLLWWRAWSRRPSPSNHIVSNMLPYLGALLVILALPLRIIEEANPDWRPLNYYFMGQAILITALIVDCSGGRAWLRHFAFPLLFPLVAVPWPSGIENEIIQGLQRCIASISVEGASWMGWAAFQRGNLIVLSHGIVGVNEACSGIRSLQSSLMIALFLGDYFQLATFRRCILVALALILAFVFNAMRAFLLIVVMDLHGAAIMSKFHDPAGLSIALANLLLLWVASSIWAGHKVNILSKLQPQVRNLRFPAQWSIFLLLAWSGAEVLNQGWYLWHEQNIVSGPVWTLLWPPPRPKFKEEKIDEVAQTYLRYDQGLHGEWKDQFQWDIYFFTWKPSRVAAGLAQIHHPDICLPAAGFILKEDVGIKKMEINGLILPVNRYVFQDPFNGQFLYVFQAVTDDRIRKDVIDEQSEDPYRLHRLQAAWTGRRNLGQRSLLIVNQGANNLEEAEIAVQSLLKDSLVIYP